MNYLKIEPFDVGNGIGVRTTIWVSGCSHHCNECYNKESWNPEAGQKFDASAKEKLFSALSNPNINGLSLTGGDPLYDGNRIEIESLLKEVKEKFPKKNIWLWTGFYFEEIRNLPLQKYIDVLVDGPFIADQKNLSLPFRGSSNQRIINVQESLKSNSTILYNL